MSVQLYLNPSTVPGEIYVMWSTLAEAYPLRDSAAPGAVEVEFKAESDPGVSAVSLHGGKAVVRYGSVSAAARAVGSLLAGLEGEESTAFKTLGIMLDCSRNAVMKVDYVKKWMRQLALMGYGRVMLYTEDTYELPDEPFFGYMRGAYSPAELREIDAYGRRLGIEVVGCIQTLGHLEQMLRWPAYGKVRDTASVLLVDEEATYELIEKMIAACAECIASRTLHIGMDETHDLGRGRFMDRYGYERGFDIFNRHLARVEKICGKYGLKPMIWSDMYFRMGNPEGDYYAHSTVIPEDVAKAIPAKVDLVYWDYYHDDEAFYTEWIKRHRDLGKEPIFGSGVWTWSRFWYDHRITAKTVVPGLAAARKARLEHVFFTLWGDDGAFCEYDSAMAGLAYAGDLSWGRDGSEERVAARLKAVSGLDYRRALEFSDIEYPDPRNEEFPGHTLLWEDPLQSIHTAAAAVSYEGWFDRVRATYERLAAMPEAELSLPERHARLICETLAARLRFRQALETAYAKREAVKLDELAGIEIPKLIRLYKDLVISFRSQWLRRNKPFGLEVIQLRLWSVIGRFEETALRVRELLNGTIARIDELDEAARMRPGQYREMPNFLHAAGTYTARSVMSASVSI